MRPNGTDTQGKIAAPGWRELQGADVNQEQWKLMVSKEAASTKWQAAAGFLAWVALLLFAASLVTGWGNSWVLGMVVIAGAGMWAAERAMHRETMRVLEEMARAAATRGGLEA